MNMLDILRVKLQYKISSLNSNLSSLFKPVLLLQTEPIKTTNETKYACNWSNYIYLIVGVGSYGNYWETHVVPTSYFKLTSATNRLQFLLSETARVEVRKCDDSNVYIISNNANQYYSVKIWGILSV